MSVTQSRTSSEPTESLSKLHERLAIADVEYLSYGYRNPSDSFIGSTDIAGNLAKRNWSQDQDCWISVNPIQQVSQGRGTAADVTRLVAVFADLDLKDGCFTSLDQMDQCIADLTDAIGCPPAAIISSGGGKQPVWAIEDGETLDNQRSAALLRRFGGLVRAVAGNLGASVDSVFDLSRVLRVPGTLNHKYSPPKPASAEFPGSWRPLGHQELSDRLDERDIPDVASVGTGSVVSAPDDWAYGTKTCGFMQKVLRDIPTDTPRSGRHSWALGRCYKLAAAIRNGCITAEDTEKFQEDLTARLKHMRTKGIAGEKGPDRPDEVSELINEAITQISQRSDEEYVKELGSHCENGHQKVEIGRDEEDWFSKNLGTPSASPQSEDPWAPGYVAPTVEDEYQSPLEPVRFKNLSALTAERDFVIPHLLHEGDQGFLYSEPGTGKSLLALEIAVNLALGSQMFDENQKPTRVLYLDYENSLSHIKERLESMGYEDEQAWEALEENLIYPNNVDELPPLNTKEGGEALLKAAKFYNAKLVIIDTLMSSIDGDENESDTFLQLGRNTTNRMRSAGIACLYLDHQGKDAKKGIRGSSAKIKDIDVVYYLSGQRSPYKLDRQKARGNYDTHQNSKLHREEDPLKHRLEDQDFTWEGKIKRLMQEADNLGLPDDAGRRPLHEALQKAGNKEVSQRSAAEVAKRRMKRVRIEEVPAVAEALTDGSL